MSRWQLVSFVFPALLVATSVLAGETFEVRHGGVPLLHSPDFGSTSVGWVRSRTRVEELERRQCWIRVREVGGSGRSGWVYGPAVGRLSGEVGTPQNTLFARFRQRLERLNRRVRETVGSVFFTEARPLEDGTVQLTATRSWLATPESHRASNLRTLDALWRNSGSAQPLNIRVVDSRGALRMSHQIQ